MAMSFSKNHCHIFQRVLACLGVSEEHGDFIGDQHRHENEIVPSPNRIEGDGVDESVGYVSKNH